MSGHSLAGFRCSRLLATGSQLCRVHLKQLTVRVIMQNQIAFLIDARFLAAADALFDGGFEGFRRDGIDAVFDGRALAGQGLDCVFVRLKSFQ